MLIRKHIHSLLSSYYKQHHNAVVGSIFNSPTYPTKNRNITDNPIKFKRLFGEWHWKYIHQRLYKQQIGQWLTPVELFKPYYSQIIANFIAKEVENNHDKKIHDNDNKIMCTHHNSHDQSLQIVEIGGGRGTNALCILDHLQEKYPNVYDKLDKYIIMDSSPSLLQLMQEILIEGDDCQSENQEHRMNRHYNKVNLIQVDMIDIAEKRSSFLEDKSNRQTIVIALEVLDNLPHDKIAKCKETGAILQGEVQLMKSISGTGNTTLKEEIFQPLSDELLKAVISLQHSYSPSVIDGGSPKWVPTTACGVINEIFSSRPHSSILFADFDWLPPPQLIETKSVTKRRSIEGVNEPLITSMDDVDHLCYLEAPSHCDILYPTNFEHLEGYTKAILIDQNIISSSVKSMKQNEFLLEYGMSEIEETKGFTGFSPLLEDFSNCSAMIVSRN